ncbi:hypothetical protein ONS96_006269 [Cadophora gregata f. sp. sojae]|nr:hypothetical protein ONS96_006269 [Cadophora gregata f. sp. sojae]
MGPPDSFPQFNHFPLELRQLIWKCCLPRRIAEEDFPFTLLDGKESRQACWPVRTTLQNARVPLLALVCREAREVVFEWGGHQISYDKTSLRSIWVQPNIDRALHINWTRRRDEEYYRINDCDDSELGNCTMDIFVYRANEIYDMRISVDGEFLYPFDLEELKHPHFLAPLDTDSAGSDFMSLSTPSMPVGKSEDTRAHDLGKMVDGLYDYENKTVYATVVIISIHVDRAAALESGLFGLQADAPVQTVNYDDTSKFSQFYELYKSDLVLREAEPHAEKLFEIILSPGFAVAVLSWQEKVRWLLQVAVWRNFQRKACLKTFEGTDPGSVWRPPVPAKQKFMRMDQFAPNEDHRWWGENAEKHVPKVVPQVMFRLCDNRCYREERRPEMFGEVWISANVVHKYQEDKRPGRVIHWDAAWDE